MKTRLETLEFHVDDGLLAATLLAPATALPGMLFAHGWGGSQRQDLERARDIAGLGCVCMTFDLRGHERTREQQDVVTREHSLHDLVAAYDLLVERPGVDRESVGVIGVSYGGYLAALLTAMRPVRWLAIRTPALYPDGGWDVPKRTLNCDPQLPVFRRSRVSWKDNRALNACAMFRGDVLIIEAEHDALVPHAVIENYVTALQNPKSITTRVIAGADHAFGGDGPERAYTRLLIGWLTEMIVGARSNEAAKTVSQSAQLE